jgi:hypothetical protein
MDVSRGGIAVCLTPISDAVQSRKSETWGTSARTPAKPLQGCADVRRRCGLRMLDVHVREQFPIIGD